MNLFRCLICGESYIGSAAPSHCPFCGAPGKYLVAADAYRQVPLGELSRKSRENLERALDLAVGNATFYRGAAQVADCERGRALFSALSRTETAHAVLFCQILDIPLPEELSAPGECSPSHKENLAEARKREGRAVQLYTRFLEETAEERVKQVLSAFIEIEADHFGMADE
ncbi:rubredoxin-like domain-containing protein [Trichloromonas sp.]|uniref:rubredoxin-like domain-containing protein n=1 Tax=Trichloromonas sp. TaxID=3069249 RepID=UPI002A44DD01|nr:hypothetical protein [Trichloromonas sp.]